MLPPTNKNKTDMGKFVIDEENPASIDQETTAFWGMGNGRSVGNKGLSSSRGGGELKFWDRRSYGLGFIYDHLISTEDI